MIELKNNQVNECNHDLQRKKLNFNEWYKFVEIEMASGRRQTQCVKCKKWFFPSEL